MSVFFQVQAVEAPVIRASQQGESSIFINWPSVADADYYELYAASANPSDFRSLGVVNGVEYTYSGALTGEEYCFYLIAISYSQGESGSSNIACVTMSGHDPDPVDAPDIKGEASIFTSGGQLVLKNYEKEYSIPSDGSFVLYSSSYVYLKIEESVDIKMAAIDVEGELYVEVAEGMNVKITISQDNANQYKAAVKAGRLDLIGTGGTLELVDETSGRDCGLLLDNSLTVDGPHTFSFPSAKKYGIKAGSYIKIFDGATFTVASDSVGIYSNSHLWVEKSATITVEAVHADGAAILLEGNDTGIFLYAGEDSGDRINLNAHSVDGCGIKIDGNGSIIAQGEYISADNWKTELVTSGVISGINLTGHGYIKADGAFVQGTRNGADGNISAVHAPHNLYALNQGKIEEIYREANLTITGEPYDIVRKNPAIGNNMRNVTTYQWEPSDKVRALPEGLIGLDEASGVTLTAVRDNVQNSEHTKIDYVAAVNNSIHKIILDGSTFSKYINVTVYWYDNYQEYKFYDSYGQDIDRFVSSEPYWCSKEVKLVERGHIEDPGYYMLPAIISPMPSGCEYYNQKSSVYPTQSFEVFSDAKIVVFVYYQDYE